MSQPEPWDLVAEGYAEQAAFVMEAFSREALKLARLAPGSRIIDVAAGSGVLSLLAAREAASVEAVDFSERMLAALRTRAQAAGAHHVRTTLGDGQALPFADAEFDAAFSMFGLMFFPDRARGFSELWRVLKPGGRAVVSSWAPVQSSPLIQVMFEAVRQVDPSSFVPPANLLSLENPELFEREFEQAGFEGVCITPHTIEVEVTSVDDLWHSMTRSSAPLCLLRKRLGEAEWQRGAALAKAYLEQRFSEGPPSLSTTAYLGFGHKASEHKV